MSQYPYPGLRPFNIEENDIFFGREQQVDDLLDRLSELQFLAVTGNSGCGKSSLIYAGLIPAIKGGLLTTAGLKWRFAIMRPGENPIRNLAEALSNAFKDDTDIDPKFKSTSELESWLKEGPLALNEIINSVNLPENTKLLLLVDQFEEIFRYSETISSDEAEAFVSLLLSTVKYTNPVYTIITMRSDFIGDCSKFLGLPEAINEGQYLTPRLTREQLQEAIVEPAEIFDTEIEPALVNRILNEMGSDPDQLPLMQHALMYMWMRKNEGYLADQATTAEPITLSLNDYDAIGGISDALTNHANEAYNNLTEDQQDIAKTMFQGLAERTNDNLYIRRPSKVNTILSLTDASLSELTEVVDAFRRSSCNFLLPPINVKITEDTIIDISHESLIRKWRLLHEWVDREAEYINTYRRLEETASLWEKGDAALYRPPDLNLALRWRERRAKPEWAQQYGDKYNLVRKFIEESEGNFKSEEKWKRYRSFGLGVGTMIVLILAYVIVMYAQQSEDASKRASVMKIQRDLTLAENVSDPLLQDVLVLRAVEELEELDTEGDLDEVTKNSNEFNKRLRRLAGNSVFQTREKRVFGGFNNRISAVTFGPNDSIIAVSSGDKDNQIKLWKKTDDEWAEDKTLNGHDDFVTDIQFSMDGSQLASSSRDGSVIIWNIEDGKPITSLKRKYYITEDTINKLSAMSMGSKGYEYGRGMEQRSQEYSYVGDNIISALEAILSSPENKEGFESVDDIIKLTKEHTSKISQFSTTTDKGSVQPEIYLWLEDLLTPDLKVIGHDNAVTAIDYHYGINKIATSGRDGKVIIWDVSSTDISNPELLTLRAGHHLNEQYIGNFKNVVSDNKMQEITGAVEVLLSESPSGYAFYTDKEFLDRIEDHIGRRLNPRELKLIPQPVGHSNAVLDVKFSGDGSKIATSGDDTRVILWNANSGEILQVLDRRYFITDDTIIKLRNALFNKGPLDQQVIDNIEQMMSDESNSRGYSYTEMKTSIEDSLGYPLSFDLEGIIFDHLKLVGHDSSVTSISFNKSGTALISVGQDGKMIAWKDISNNPHKSAETLSGHRGFIYSVDINDEDLIVTSGHDGDIKIWDLENAKTPIITISNVNSSIQSDKEPISKVEFSTDGEFVISGSFDRTARIWDLQKEGTDDIELEFNQVFINTGGGIAGSIRALTEYIEDTSKDVRILSLDFSPVDSLVAASTDDGHVIIWDLADAGNPIIKKAHKSEIYEIDFNNDGSMLATAGWDNKAKLWDTKHIKEKKEIVDLNVEVEHAEKVYDVAFNHDGTLFATGSWDGTVRLWNVDGSPLLVGWDIESIKPIYVIYDHQDGVYNVEFDKQGSRLLTTSIDQKAIVWTISDDPFEINKYLTLQGDEAVYGASFLDSGGDGRDGTDDLIVTSTRNGTVKFWEKDTGESLATHSNDGGWVAKLDTNDHKELIAFSDRSQKITILDYEGHIVDELNMDDLYADIKDISFNEDGTKLGIAYGNRILIKPIGNTINGESIEYSQIKELIGQRTDNITKVGEFCLENWRLLPFCHPYYLKNRAIIGLYEQDEEQTIKLLDNAYASYQNNKDLSESAKDNNLDMFKQIHDEFSDHNSDSELEEIKELKAAQLLEAAKKLEDSNLITESNDLKERALKLDDDATIETDNKEYNEQKLYNLIKRSSILAHSGQIEEAKKNIPEIVDLSSRLEDSVPKNLIKVYINVIGIDALLRNGITLSMQSKIEQAKTQYDKAEKLQDESIELAQDLEGINVDVIRGSDYNILCWFGSLSNKASDVLYACELAVEKAEDDYNKMISKDSRALAYLILANDPSNSDKKQAYLNRASKDLNEYITFMSSNTFEDQVGLIPIRSKWLADIRNGVNPITPDVIEQLKTEGEQTDVQIQQAY